MKKMGFSLTLSTWLICSGVSAMAQEAMAKTGPPPGPLLATPDSAQWQVTISQQKTGDGAQNQQAEVTEVKTVEVLGKARHEERKENSGYQMSIWCLGGNEVYKGSNWPHFTICDPLDLIYYMVNPKSTFIELAWVSPRNFIGLKNINGKPAIVCGEPPQSLSPTQRADLLAPETTDGSHFKKTTLDKVAYISLETRLPIYFGEGIQQSIYQFGSAPSAPLVPPDEVTLLLKMREAQVKRLSAQPARS